MGSFYSTCSITDLSIIDGDDMYMQLIIPTWVKNPYSIDGDKIGCGEKGLRVSNEGPLGEFVPFGFPILGKYADYGDIDSITKDRNIEMLEEFFGIPIDDVIACATDDRWYKHSYQSSVENGEKEEYKGQFKSWTVGGNKMKNVAILKQLTVTYFKKEHYDFLSKEMLSCDSYYNKERKKRLDKMTILLVDLEKARPKNVDQPLKELKDITDEMRERYSKLFGKEEMNDELILSLMNHTRSSWWESFNYKFYIPSISNVNMFKKLPIGPLDADEVKKQYTFISNMSNLYKTLRPSYYGSQQDNFKAYTEFHKMTTELVGDTILTKKKDTILNEISWVLKSNLKKINNKEISEKIKKDIIEGLEEYGYKIEL